MSYLILKHIHVTFAFLTLISFSLRGVWMMQESSLLQRRLTRILPHAIDTVLLASAVAMVVMASLSPVVQVWLGIKILAVLVYIVLGTIALKRGSSKRIRIIAFVAALVIFSYIIFIAYNKTPVLL